MNIKEEKKRNYSKTKHKNNILGSSPEGSSRMYQIQGYKKMELCNEHKRRRKKKGITARPNTRRTSGQSLIRHHHDFMEITYYFVNLIVPR